MKKKLCCIFNIPSLYRETIYLNIDKRYDCDWYFEQVDSNGIALFDTGKLQSCKFLKHKRLWGRMYKVKGLVSLLWNKKDYEAYLMIGAPMCVSIWILCILIKIFHPSKKIYFWTHGWYGKESLSEKIIKKTFLRLADELFIYGDYATNLLVKEGFDIEKVHPIHNSLSYDVQLKLRMEMKSSLIYRDHFGNSFPVLLFIGRLTPVKRLDLLVDAVDVLNKSGNPFNLVFIGDGVERERLRSLVERYGLQKQVWFFGECYSEQTNAKLIYNADLCVAPGNIGLTAIHVMMFGCPAITHNDFKWQMPEFEAIKSKETGMYFEKGNIDSLVTAISDWFEIKRKEREEVRLACYKEIDNNWNPYYQMNIIKEVLG